MLSCDNLAELFQRCGESEPQKSSLTKDISTQGCLWKNDLDFRIRWSSKKPSRIKLQIFLWESWERCRASTKIPTDLSRWRYPKRSTPRKKQRWNHWKDREHQFCYTSCATKQVERYPGWGELKKAPQPNREQRTCGQELQCRHPFAWISPRDKFRMSTLERRIISRMNTCVSFLRSFKVSKWNLK